MDGEEWEGWVEGEERAVLELEGVAEDGPGGPPVVPNSQTRQTTNGREARLEQEQEQQRTTRTRWPLRTKIRPGAIDGGV